MRGRGVALIPTVSGAQKKTEHDAGSSTHEEDEDEEGNGTLLFNVTSVQANLCDVYPPARMRYHFPPFPASLKHRWSDRLYAARTLEGVQSNLTEPSG